jgi:hypothetical protein
LLSLDDCARLTLVVYTQNFAPDLELSAFRSYWQRLEKLQLALAVKNTLGIELWYTFDRCTVATRIEVDDILVGMLEWQDDGVSREGSERWVKFLHERQESFFEVIVPWNHAYCTC